MNITKYYDIKNNKIFLYIIIVLTIITPIFFQVHYIISEDISAGYFYEDISIIKSNNFVVNNTFNNFSNRIIRLTLDLRFKNC